MRTNLSAFLLVSLLLAGCPPTDDDDTAACPDLEQDTDEDGTIDCEDDTPLGDAPVIAGVSVCELVPSPAACPTPAWVVDFRVSVEDEDCNFDNPWWVLRLEGAAPLDDRLEGSLGCGGTMRLQICSENWVRGADIGFEIEVEDDLGARSEVWGPDTWTVPQVGDDDCP